MDNSSKILMEFEKPLSELYRKIEDLKKISKGGTIDLSQETEMLKKRIDHKRKEIFANLTPMQTVQMARHPERPNTLEYANLIFEDFIELHGDRNFADDSAMVGGIGKLDGKGIVLIGHQKGKTTKENIKRNFGMAHPEGYRKALRLMRFAERFGKPIITFIDTPGAYPGIGAEERGQAEAIAKNLREMFAIEVPIISIITGEGGSGGALGIGIGNKVLMMEYSIYSVISPEGCASILFRDAKRAEEAAIAMKITAKDLLKSKVIDEIIKEPTGGSHLDHKAAAKNVKAAIIKHLTELDKFSEAELIEDRLSKFRKLGEFIDIGAD